jgi:hypothetical protein
MYIVEEFGDMLAEHVRFGADADEDPSTTCLCSQTRVSALAERLSR